MTEEERQIKEKVHTEKLKDIQKQEEEEKREMDRMLRQRQREM